MIGASRVDSMRFLVDESTDFAVARALAEDGHDVAAVAHLMRGAPDDEVMALADRENRILLTEDKDFGQIFYADLSRRRTVILIRFPIPLRASLGSSMTDLIRRSGDQIIGCFVVIQPGHIRIGRRPGT
ncbi:MAG: DUF5615 family PIN-like protein [Chloroflexota bacterium]